MLLEACVNSAISAIEARVGVPTGLSCVRTWLMAGVLPVREL